MSDTEQLRQQAEKFRERYAAVREQMDRLQAAASEACLWHVFVHFVRNGRLGAKNVIIEIPKTRPKTRVGT